MTTFDWFRGNLKSPSILHFRENAREKYAMLVSLATGENSVIGQILHGGWGWTTLTGIAGVAFTSADQHSAAAAVTDAPGAGLKLVVDSVLVAAGATAQVFTFSEETSGTIVGYVAVPANSSFNWKPEGKLKLATAAKKLMVLSGAAGNVYVTAVYHFEA